jgi:hypothetical protein
MKKLLLIETERYTGIFVPQTQEETETVLRMSAVPFIQLLSSRGWGTQKQQQNDDDDEESVSDSEDDGRKNVLPHFDTTLHAVMFLFDESRGVFDFFVPEVFVGQFAAKKIVVFRDKSVHGRLLKAESITAAFANAWVWDWKLLGKRKTSFRYDEKETEGSSDQLRLGETFEILFWPPSSSSSSSTMSTLVDMILAGLNKDNGEDRILQGSLRSMEHAATENRGAHLSDLVRVINENRLFTQARDKRLALWQIAHSSRCYGGSFGAVTFGQLLSYLE